MVFLYRSSIITFVVILTLLGHFIVRRTTVDDEMFADDISVQYTTKLLDFHFSTGMPPSQFLTWGNLTSCPTLLLDKCLDGLDWDSMPSLFDRVDAIKATHIDLDIATVQWMNESYDVFNPDGVVSHNLVLVLFLTPNHEAWIESLNELLGDFVISAVVMYKQTAQRTCSLRKAVNKLCVLAQEKTPSLAFVSLSEVASYFPYPTTSDHIDYTIVPVSNVMTRVVGPTLGFIVGRLLRMLEGDVMNVVLPPAFGMNADMQDFNFVPHLVRGAMWSNYQFINLENGNENFTHMVPVNPVNVFQVDLGDQVCRSALGICLVPPPQFTYQTDLTKVGYDVASQFASALKKGKSLTAAASSKLADPTTPVDAEVASSTTVPTNQPQGTFKTTDKCKTKSSSKSCTDNSHGNPNEVKTVTSDTAATAGSDATTNSLRDPPTINEVWEMVCHLFNKSRILDECQARVAWAVAAVVSKHHTQLFVPFTSYLSDVTDTVESWCTKITVIHPEMAHCSYETYHECTANIWEKTNEYFRRLHNLNTTLVQQTAVPELTQAVKPDDEHDLGFGSSVDPPAMLAHDTSSVSTPSTQTDENNPFPEEIIDIMKDVETSVRMYVQVMTKAVAEHLGGVEVTAYLGHIFSTGLNFQTSMWQLVMTEAVHLPIMTREHLRQETETLRLFAEVIPILAPCSIPPPPFPTADLTLPVLQSVCGTIVSKSSLPFLPEGSGTTKGTEPTSCTAISMISSTEGTQPSTPLSGRQKLQSRLGTKIVSHATPPIIGVQEGASKAVVCVAPSQDTQPSGDSTPLTPLLINIAQLSTNIRCQLGDGAPSNGQPNVKRQKLDEGASSVAAGSSASVAISVDNAFKDDDDDDGIEILEDEDDEDDDTTMVTIDAQGTAGMTNTSNATPFPPFALMDLHDDVVADIKGEKCKKILNKLQWQNYNLDAFWFKHLHLQLPQEPRSNQNIDDMTEHMLRETKSNRYMQQCIFSVASIRNRTEGNFSTQFKEIMERTHSSKNFQVSRGHH